MNLQERDLSLQMQGEDVQLLHAELHQLGYKIPTEETKRAFFGEGTLQAVLDFQRKRGLQPTGVVDERTAHAINVAVEAHRPVPEQFVVSGQVRHKDETPLAGLTVRAIDIGPLEETQLGEDVVTGRRGEYKIAFPSAQVAETGKRRPDLVVRVFSPEGELLVQSAVRPNAADKETVELIVEPSVEPAPPEEQQTHRVTIRLLNKETGEPLSGYSVRSFDLDVGKEPVDLGFDITNARGLCTVVYTTPQAPRREEGGEYPGRRLRLHIVDAQGQEIYMTEIRVAPDEQEIVEVRVAVPTIPELPSPSLEDLGKKLNLKLPNLCN